MPEYARGARDQREVFFYSLGRKWEGNNQFFWCGKEMGRKKVIMSVWERNGKDIIRLVGMGGKWEGNYDISWHCKEMGRTKRLVLVGEGNGKETFIFVGVGRKKEGKN